MKSRIISVLLATTMAVSLLAGCGSASQGITEEASTGEAEEETEVKETEEPVEEETAQEETAEDITGEIVVLTHRTDLVGEGGKFETYKEAFEAKYPGTKVTFEAIDDYDNDVSIRMGSTEYGDVLMIPNSASSGDFADFFEPLGTIDELSEVYNADFLSAKVSGDTVYGLASCANAQGIVYNKQVFADAGITELPKTPDEFLADLKLIKDNTEAIPYYTNYPEGWTMEQWADHCFGSVTGNANYHNNELPNTESPFSEGSSTYTVFKLMYDIVAQGLCEADPITDDWNQSKVDMNEGKIGTMVLGSWAISQMMDPDGDGTVTNAENIGYMAFPYNIDGVQYATAGADRCYAINVNSANKATARAWIDYMLLESGFALSEGSISIVKDDPMPETLSDFADISFVVDTPATAENTDKYDIISQESGVGLTSNDAAKQEIIDAALGNNSKTFDEIMEEWNTMWNERLAEWE